jgi:hypothetical protein
MPSDTTDGTSLCESHGTGFRACALLQLVGAGLGVCVLLGREFVGVRVFTSML